MLSSGFYNSKGGDRKYDAEQFGAMFNGLIADGVFAHYKDALKVTAGSGNRELVVKPGRAWFNGTWTEVDDNGHSVYLMGSAVETTYFVYLAVNKLDRKNTIAWYSNIMNNDPEKGLYFYLLAQVTVPGGATKISDSMITDTRGSDLCPYATGIMEAVSFEELVKRVCGDSWQDWLGVYEAGITTGVQNAMATSERALKEVKSMKAYAVESEAVGYIWAKFEAVPTGGGGFEWATDSVHTELSDPPMPMCLFRDLSYADLGPSIKPNITLNSPYIAEGETDVKAIPAVTQSKVWREYPYFWEGGASFGTEVLRYDDLQRVVVNVGGTVTERYRYRVSRLMHIPVTYEPGAYIGTVNADNATVYPRDGYKDGYYYMRFAARAEDVSFYYPGLSAKNVKDAIIEVVKTGSNGSGSAMSVIEVEELPSTGARGSLYIVKGPGDSDASEYLWLDRWEKIGGTDSGQNAALPSAGNYAALKAAILGDSNTAVNYFKAKTWWMWALELLGISNYVNYGVNGATLSSLGADGKRICEIYDSMDADADVIFVMAGVNEFRSDTQTPFGSVSDTTPETISGAVRYICRSLQRKYPGKPIVFITPTNQSLWTHTEGKSMADLSRAIMDACHMEGVLCLDAQGSLGINPAGESVFTADRLHLNDLGSELLGRWVANQVVVNVPVLSNMTGGETPEEPEPEKTLSSISATYSGGAVPVGTAASALTGVVVTAHYSDGTSYTVTGYTLSGTIVEGDNTITVSYGGKTTTFAVTGVDESAEEPPTPDPDGYVSLADYGYTSGYFVNEKGEKTIGNGMMYSDMIPVPADTEITYTGDCLTNPVFFDADKAFISANQANDGWVIGTPKEYTVKTPANCAYAVFNMWVQTGIDKYYVKWGESNSGGDSGGDGGGDSDEEIVTLNLADYDITENSYIPTNGQAMTGVTGWKYTEKIPVPASTDITVCVECRLNPAFYDAEGNFISTNDIGSGITQGTPQEVVVTTPENCAYIVINISPSTDDRSVLYIKYDE